MARLNQIIAVEKGVKSQSFQELSEAHQSLQKPALLSGISRAYRPKDEEGEQLPPESTRVQLKAQAVIDETVASLAEASCGATPMGASNVSVTNREGLCPNRRRRASPRTTCSECS